MVFGRGGRNNKGSGGGTSNPKKNSTDHKGEDDNNNDNIVVDHMDDDDMIMIQPSPVTDLLGLDTSAISLDGRSLIVPETIGGGGGGGSGVTGDTNGSDYDFEEDMSSLGTSKFGGNTYGSNHHHNDSNNKGRRSSSNDHFGATIGYIGDMRVISRSDEYYSDVAPPLAPTSTTTKNQLPPPPPQHESTTTALNTTSKPSTSWSSSWSSSKHRRRQRDSSSYAIDADYSVREEEEYVVAQMAAADDQESPQTHGSQQDMEHGTADSAGIPAVDKSIVKKKKIKKKPSKLMKMKENKTDDDSMMDGNDDYDEETWFCCPKWLLKSPFWLKIVIVSSLALLIGAIVLVGIGVAFITTKDGDDNGSSSGSLSSTDTMSPTPYPTMLPTSSSYVIGDIFNNNTNSSGDSGSNNNNNNGDNDETSVTTTTTTTLPTMSPTSPPSASRPGGSSGGGGNGPSPPGPQQPTSVSFYVMGGRFDGQELVQLRSDLPVLPITYTSPSRETSLPVMFHLGDWNSPFATSCDEASYTTNVDTYMQSSVPVYFVPGDNEFNDCPDPQEAFGFWYEHFLDFESRHWQPPTWTVSRQVPNYAENFNFLQGRVLFTGVNIVGGIVHDQQEWDTRHASNLEWINQTVTTHDGDFDILVVFGHADPDIEINENFFTGFFDLVRSYDEHVVFMHRNLGADSWQLEPAFNGIPNLDVVVVEGSSWPPMFVEIDLERRVLTMDQGSWFNDYSSTGEFAFSNAAISGTF